MLFVYLVSQVTNKLPTTNSIGEILLTISRAHVATCPVVYIYIYVLLLRLLWKLNHNRKTSKLQRRLADSQTCSRLRHMPTCR